MADKLRVGIIGCGGITEHIHLKSLAALKSVAVTALCDVRIERAQKCAERFPGASIWDNYLLMLVQAELDCVLVLTQPDQLFRITLDCIRAGKAVFVEKPAGITVFQVESLAREAGKVGGIVQVGLNRRYMPLVREVVKRMASVSAITQVAGCFIKHDSASFYDGCADAFTCDTIHAIDLMRHLAGADRAVTASTATMRAGGEEITNVWNSVMRFDNGVTGTLTANYQTGGRVHTFEMHSPGASAYINLGFGGADCDARIIYYGGSPMYSMSASGSGGVKGNYEYLDGTEIAGSSEYNVYYGYYAEMAEFFECVRTNTAPDCDIGEALKSMELMQFLRDNTNL